MQSVPSPGGPARVGAHALALDDFRLVRAIAAARGLAGAAAELGVNHSTAFRRLGQLEQTLGCSLFERHRTGYEPTPAGEEMVQIAVRMEEEAAAFVRKVEGKSLAPSGELRVTTNDGLLVAPLTPIFAAFTRRYPDIRLDVVLGNAALNLSRRDADVAIRATEKPPDTLVGRRIATIAWCVYGRRADFEGVDLDDPDLLRGRAWAGLGEDLATIKAARFVQETAAERVVYRVNTVAGLVDAVVQGIGVGPLPCIAGDAHPALLRLSRPQQDISGTLWLLTHPDLRQAPRVRAFMDFVGTELTKRRSLLEGSES